MDKNVDYELSKEEIEELEKKLEKVILEIEEKYTEKDPNISIEKCFDASVDKILQNLYLGNIEIACSLKVLQKIGITHILQVCPKRKDLPKFPNEFKYFVVEVLDEPQEDIRPHFLNSVEFIRKSMEVKKNIVFVHCQMGKSRSSSMVIAYLMRERKMKFLEAYKFVQSKRSIIRPNKGFLKQLLVFEKYCEKNPSTFISKEKSNCCLIL